MTPEETFGQLFGLGQAWRSVEARLEVSMFVLKVEETPDLWPEESALAGTPVSCFDHVESMQWRHLNVFNKEYVIVCALPRGRRVNDGTVYRVTPPWEGRSKHFNQEFEGIRPAVRSSGFGLSGAVWLREQRLDAAGWVEAAPDGVRDPGDTQ